MCSSDLDPTLPLGVLPAGTVSGCHTCRQEPLQMNLAADSPLRLYSVMPCASTRIVPPLRELAALLTSALEPPLA